jgi:hypothetical protein
MNNIESLKAHKTEKTEPVFYVITICWNESLILKQFLDYYSFAEKIIIFDNMSSDNSVSIAKAYNNVEISYYNTDEKIRDDIYLEIKNNAWKQFRKSCDWFIIVDIDEFIYHPLGIPGYVNSLRPNVATLQCKGYEMFCPNILESPGDKILHKSKYGIPGTKLDKTTLINSKLVYDINYLGGCHAAFPKSSGIHHIDPNFKLLHYKFVYPIQFMISRYKQMSSRLSKQNIENGWGIHYKNINNLIIKYNNLSKSCSPVI